VNRPPSKEQVEAIRARMIDNHPGDVSFGHEDVQVLFDHIDYQAVLLKDSREEMREAGREFREIERERAALIQKYEDERWGAW
jgi:hypothetical protein